MGVPADNMRTILICGGGFAGFAAARKLAERNDIPGVRILVLDESVFHVYHAWLYEVATFALEHDIAEGALHDAVCVPTETLEAYDSHDCLQFIREEITGIDLATKTVITAEGHRYTGDVLIAALGSVTNDFGIPGINEYAFEMKTAEHAIAIHERMQELFRSVQLGSQHSRIVIGGGGTSGVELAAELANYIRHVEQRHHLPPNRMRVEIVEAQERILSGFPERARRIAEARLKKLGVTFCLGKTITRLSRDQYALADGTQHRHDMFVWTGGIKPHPVVATTGFPLDKRGRILVDEFLAVHGYPGVFAAGDIAAFTPADAKQALPPTGQVARQEGMQVAENCVRFLNTKPLLPAQIVQKGYVIPLGGRFAIAAFPGITFGGMLGYLLRRYVDFRYLAGIMPFWHAVVFFFSGVRLFSKND